MNRLLKMGITAGVAIVAQASAGLIDVTGGFNVLTFGNFSSSNDQTWGSLGASGNVNIIDSYSIGTAWANSGVYPTNAIVAGGNVSLTGSGSVWGGVSAGGTVTATQTIHGATNQNVSNINNLFNFEGAKADLKSISSQIASSSNSISAVSKWGGLYFSGANTDVNYFTVSANDFKDISYLQFEIANGSKAVITVTGGSANLVTSWGGNFGINGLGSDGGKSYASNVLWNFTDATSLTVGGSIGTILAVDANVKMVGGEIYGDLITGSVTGSSEIHLAHYTGNVPPPSHNVPENSAAAMMVAGACVLLVVSRKKIFVNK